MEREGSKKFREAEGALIHEGKKWNAKTAEESETWHRG